MAAASLQCTTGAFIDDLMNGAQDHASNVEAAEKLFTALEAANFRAGAGKVSLGEDRLLAMGFEVKDGTIRPDPARTSAISALLPPANRS